MTDDEVLRLIQAQHDLMVAVAVGDVRIATGNDEYRERRRTITAALSAKGIDDPNPFDDLWAWYEGWKEADLKSYASRREFLSKLLRPLYDALDGSRVEVPQPTGWANVDRVLGFAARQLPSARNTEEFQQIGLLCREALISLAQCVYDPVVHSNSAQAVPSATDANRMLEAFLARELAGSSNEAARKHAKGALELANTVQHRRRAGNLDAALCLEATCSVANIVSLLAGKRADNDTPAPRIRRRPAGEPRVSGPSSNESAAARMKRILDLMGAEQQWLRGSFTLADGDGERKIELPTERGPFRLYARPRAGLEERFWYVAQLTPRAGLNTVLADARVLLSACSEGQNVVCTFIVFTNDDLADAKTDARRAFEAMQQFAPAQYRDLFHLEIWDASVLAVKERELGIRIDSWRLPFTKADSPICPLIVPFGSPVSATTSRVGRARSVAARFQCKRRE